jgi:hypothetical protein
MISRAQEISGPTGVFPKHGMSRSDMVPPHPERRLVGRYSLIHLSSHMAFPNAVHRDHYPQAAFLKKIRLARRCRACELESRTRRYLEIRLFYKPVFKYIFIHY